jgi:apoptosis-stimulating of p53 protein 2
MDHSISELQAISVHQKVQIEQNQQLLLSREQRLKYLNQQQTTQENIRLKRLKQHLEQQELKNFRLKTLQNQINQQKTSNSTFGLLIKKKKILFSNKLIFICLENELEILKEIFLTKEHELTISLNKLDELTKQLDQLRKIKITTNKEQSQNRNELDKLKQELMVYYFFSFNY